MPRHAKPNPIAPDTAPATAAAPAEQPAPAPTGQPAGAPGDAPAPAPAPAPASAVPPAPAPAPATPSAPAPAVPPAISPTPKAQYAPAKPRKGLRAALVIILVLIVLAGAAGAILVLRPPFAEGLLQAIGIVSAPSPSSAAGAAGVTQGGSFSAIGDTAPTAAEQATMDAEAKEALRTPIIAQCNGIDLHSPISMKDLTGIVFHQASNDYALVISTQLPEADYDRVAEDRTMRINHDQENKPGTWADTEALHLWRDSGSTEMDTSIDVGALAGAPVVSPVDGTVVLIRDYVLEDTVNDIEIHIQPTGRPDLDVVLIHTTDPVVKAGDRVEAGITPLSYVRDIEKDLTDVQLGFYTPEGVGGNHTHVQVNDTNYKDYRERRLSGAISAS